MYDETSEGCRPVYAPPWTPLKLVRWLTENFRKHRLPPPHRFEAEQMVAHALHISRLDIYLQYDKPCKERELERVRELYKRRIKREPLAYILGTCEFWTLQLLVGKGVLIPRQDTEALIDTALETIPDECGDAPYSILELGTGSAAIPLSLTMERKRLEIFSIETSSPAIHYARLNLNRYRKEIASRQNTIHLIQGDRFKAVADGNYFDLIISNPPYIPDDDISGLQSEVSLWEPREALAGGRNGLNFYRYLKRTAAHFLKIGGVLLFEHGFDQKESIRELFADSPLTYTASFRDINHKERGMKLAKL